MFRAMQIDKYDFIQIICNIKNTCIRDGRSIFAWSGDESVLGLYDLIYNDL